MVGKGKDQGGSSGRPCHVNENGSRKNRHRERSRGHTRGRAIPADARADARPGTADDGRKKHTAGERLVSATFESTALHGVSAEDGHHSDEEEEAGTNFEEAQETCDSCGGEIVCMEKALTCM